MDSLVCPKRVAESPRSTLFWDVYFYDIASHIVHVRGFTEAHNQMTKTRMLWILPVLAAVVGFAVPAVAG